MPDTYDPRTIQTDFDRLALVAQADGNDHNSHYHRFLLKHVAPHCQNALEIGCGAGAFARLLATRTEHVLALDLSPEMLRLAQTRSTQYKNIDFQLADVMQCDLPTNHFDCIVSIATLHHLPMETMLSKMKNALKENGTLLILDLFQGESLADILTSVVAIPVNILLKLIKTGHLREPAVVRAAWEEHGQRDVYLTLSQIRQYCAALLPDAQVQRHLLWRYSVVWRKTLVETN